MKKARKKGDFYFNADKSGAIRLTAFVKKNIWNCKSVFGIGNPQAASFVTPHYWIAATPRAVYKYKNLVGTKSEK